MNDRRRFLSTNDKLIEYTLYSDQIGSTVGVVGGRSITVVSNNTTKFLYSSKPFQVQLSNIPSKSSTVNLSSKISGSSTITESVRIGYNYTPSTPSYQDLCKLTYTRTTTSYSSNNSVVNYSKDIVSNTINYSKNVSNEKLAIYSNSSQSYTCDINRDVSGNSVSGSYKVTIGIDSYNGQVKYFINKLSIYHSLKVPTNIGINHEFPVEVFIDSSATTTFNHTFYSYITVTN